MLVEMLLQLKLAGGGPAGAAGPAEPVGYPSHLVQRMACGAGLTADELLERGPARLAVLPRDGHLRIVQGAEFPGGQAAFRLKLQVPQAWPARQRTWR